MKIVKNNLSNTIDFLHNKADLSSAVNVRFRQLGSDVNRDILVTSIVTDCFVSTFGFDVGVDELQNGTYSIEIIDGSDEILISATGVVEGFTESYRANIIIE